MVARLRYRGTLYVVEDGRWRGPDGQGVHLLTWISDDLLRCGAAALGTEDAELARRVAERLGEEANVVEGEGR